MTATVKFKPLSKSAVVPKPATEGAAGLDLHADNMKPLTIWPGEIKLVTTNVMIELPAGYEAQVRPRSGLALKHGITVLNSPGTIDSDYRGVIGVILINHGDEKFVVKRGDRIAQLVIAEVATQSVQYETVYELSETQRGEGGFGSTGV